VYTNSSSSRYGAEENEVLRLTLIDGLAEAHNEWRYVEASKAPVRLHGKPIAPILTSRMSQFHREAGASLKLICCCTLGKDNDHKWGQIPSLQLNQGDIREASYTSTMRI
jgi:hypothetical protein